MAFLSDYCQAKSPRNTGSAVGDTFAAYCVGVEREAIATVERFAAPLAGRPFVEGDARATYYAVRAVCDELRAAAHAASAQ